MELSIPQKTCPHGGELHHTPPAKTANVSIGVPPAIWRCAASKKGQKRQSTHLLQEYLDNVYSAVPAVAEHRRMHIVKGIRKNRAGQTKLCTAQRNHRAGLCGCKKESRHATCIPQRSCRSFKMGQAEICCHESQEASNMELEKLRFSFHSCISCAISR